MIKARVEGGALLAAGMDGESMKVLVEGVLKDQELLLLQAWMASLWRSCRRT